MIQQVMKLQDAGYSLLEIGHTKTKTKEDVITKVQFEQLTCNLDNKYYNALKDKVNLVAMCYFEHIIENVEEKKNAFTKKMNKVGELVDRKRVMVFADDDNAIDTKTHFEYIAHKIDFSAESFVNAVEEAIALKLEAFNGKAIKKAVKVEKPVPAPVIEEDDLDEEDESTSFDLDDEVEEFDDFDADAARTEIRNKNKAGTAEQKKEVKAIIASTGKKLDEIEDEDVLKRILAVFN